MSYIIVLHIVRSLVIAFVRFKVECILIENILFADRVVHYSPSNFMLCGNVYLKKEEKKKKARKKKKLITN